MAGVIRKGLRKIFALSTNNRITNPLLVLFSLDALPKTLLDQNNWTIFGYNNNKTVEENVGYSMIPHIQDLVQIIKQKFYDFAIQHLNPKDAVLDIGCGTVVILKELENTEFYLYGVDMNPPFLEVAEKRLPKAHFFRGDYLETFKAPKKFKLICCFSMLMYIEPSNINRFFNKMYNDLVPGGYVFIQYHHALNLGDLFYPDITYVRYSPRALENVVRKKFNIIQHEQFYDGRKIDWYDSKPYYFPDGTNKRLDTIENTSLLIIQKKAN